MLTGFEKETAPLTDHERTVVLTRIVSGFRKLPAGKWITNKIICSVLASEGIQVTGPRVRKIINHIRVNSLIPGLIATSQGYTVETDPVKVQEYLDSLIGRIGAIINVYNEIANQFNLKNYGT